MQDPIDRREQARWIILVAALASALYLCWLMLKPFVGVLLWAAVLSVAVEPVHRRLVARTRRPSLSAALTCLLVIFAVGLPAALIVWMTTRELGAVIAASQHIVNELMDPGSETTGPAIRWLNERIDVLHARQQVIDYLGTLGGEIAGYTLNIAQYAGLTVAQALFVLFVMFYLLRDGATVRVALAGVIPLHNRQTQALLVRVREVISASIHGSLVIAAIQGTLVGLAFWALGIPLAVLWGVVAVLVALIGAFLVWIPAAIYLAIKGAWIKAIVLTVWGVFVVGLIDNFLRPRLVGNRTQLHELLIFFAVLGGLQLFGMLGIVLGPVALAVSLSLFEEFRHPSPPPLVA